MERVKPDKGSKATSTTFLHFVLVKLSILLSLSELISKMGMVRYTKEGFKN